MITLFITLYSLLFLCTAGNASEVKELLVKTVKRGENVTIECHINVTTDENFHFVQTDFWKSASDCCKKIKGRNPQVADGFKDRFSVTVKDHKFNLITTMTEDDEGDYFCGQPDGDIVTFTSGTHLQFEGDEMKHGSTSGTHNTSTDCGTVQGSEGCPWITAFTTSIIISVILLMILIGVLFKIQRKGASSSNPRIPTNQADDEDVLNYAAVSFAKKPPSSRTSRDESHQDIYSQVKIN